MAHLAHSLDDGLIRPQTRRVRLALFARAANDNAPPGDLALTAWKEGKEGHSRLPHGDLAHGMHP